MHDIKPPAHPVQGDISLHMALLMYPQALLTKVKHRHHPAPDQRYTSV